jgi:hypothetical protein
LKRRITEFLSQLQDEYQKTRRDIWEQADYAVSDVAQSWMRYEGELGVAFDLRFFPGEASPPRGGLWTLGRTVDAACVPAPAMPGGSLYFPRPPKLPKVRPENARQDAERWRAVWSDYERQLLARGLFLQQCKSGPVPKTQFHPVQEEAYKFTQYKFFERSIRAFNALLPKSSGAFWVQTSDPRRDPKGWKRYTELVYDMVSSISQDKPSSVADAMRKYESLYAFHEEKGTSLPKHADMFARAEQYAQGMFRDLFEEGELVSTFKTRVLGDLIQTASAVRAEIEVAKQLQGNDLLGMNMGSLSQSEKRSVEFFNPKVGNPLNSWVLAAGAVALGVGGYKYWRGRRG